MKKEIIFLLFVTVVFFNCESKKNNQNSIKWHAVYKNDKNGNRVSGSKQDLIRAIRSGNPIRIGWSSKRKSDSTKTVEHFIETEFITIANSQEIFAQIKPFLGQRPDLTSDTLSMTLLPNHLHWILGTNGTISSINRNYSKDAIDENAPSTFRYDISWFSKIP